MREQVFKEISSTLPGVRDQLSVNKKEQHKAIDKALKTKKTYMDILIMAYQLGYRDGKEDLTKAYLGRFSENNKEIE